MKILTRLTAILLLVTALSGQLTVAQTPAADLRAGAARLDITPREPVPMWGYGARHDALSTGITDPLFADAVVLQFGTEKLALVGLDLGRSPSEASIQHIRERIRTEAGIRYSFIAGSHTHHGPVLELTNAPGKGQGRFDAALRYYAELEDNIVAAILEADRRRVPAHLATTSITLDQFNRNRHTKFEPKPVDRQLGLLRVADLQGATIATIVNFAAHPTMHPASMLSFSADYVGALKREVDAALGGRTIFFNGAAGDQSVNFGTEKGAGTEKGPEAFGRALGREVVRAIRELGQAESKKPATRATLVVREERFTFKSRTDLANPLVRGMYEKAFFPELIPNFIDEYAEGIRPRLTVALINGEIALVGLSGEVFASHAMRLRERARVSQLFFIGYCNGYHQYFPTIEAVAEGGYGADKEVAPVAVGAGEELMNTALRWLFELSGRKF